MKKIIKVSLFSTIGAVGVSGAPGGDKDAACAKKALDKLAERIEFAIDD